MGPKFCEVYKANNVLLGCFAAQHYSKVHTNLTPRAGGGIYSIVKEPAVTLSQSGYCRTAKID